MQLTLSREEALALDGALDRHMDRQMGEIAHTEQHDVREALKADYEQLEIIAKRLKKLLETTG